MNYLEDKEAGYLKTNVFGLFRLIASKLKHKKEAYLSQLEANSTKKYLKDNFGIESEQIKQGLGGTFASSLQNKVINSTKKAGRHKLALARLERLQNKSNVNQSSTKQPLSLSSAV